MGMIGADVEELRQLAKEFDRVSRTIETSVMKQITQRLSSAPWRGQSSQQFKALWMQKLQPSLRSVASELSKTATTLRKNADAQEVASKADNLSSPARNALADRRYPASYLGVASGPYYGTAVGSQAGSNEIGICKVPETNGYGALDPHAGGIGNVTQPLEKGAEFGGNAIPPYLASRSYGRFAPRGLDGRFVSPDRLFWKPQARFDVKNYVPNPGAGNKTVLGAGKTFSHGLKGASRVLKGVNFGLDVADQYGMDSAAHPNMSEGEKYLRSAGYAGSKAAGGAALATACGIAGGMTPFAGPIVAPLGAAFCGWLGEEIGGHLFRKWIN